MVRKIFWGRVLKDIAQVLVLLALVMLFVQAITYYKDAKEEYAEQIESKIDLIQKLEVRQRALFERVEILEREDARSITENPHQVR